MPKVDKVRIFHPVTKEYLMDLPIFFTAKDGYFKCKIDENLSAFLDGKEEFSNKNINVLKDEIIQSYKSFYTENMECQKVILYKLTYSVPATAFNPKHIYGEDITKNIHFQESAGTNIIGLDYQVYYRIQMGNNVAWSRDEFDRDMPNSFKTSYRPPSEYDEDEFLPWSQELENWFAATTLKLQGFIKAIIDFFGDEPTFLLENITKGMPLSLPEPTKKSKK